MIGNKYATIRENIIPGDGHECIGHEVIPNPLLDLSADVELPVIGWLLHLEDGVDAGDGAVHVIVLPRGCIHLGVSTLALALGDIEYILAEADIASHPDVGHGSPLGNVAVNGGHGFEQGAQQICLS